MRLSLWPRAKGGGGCVGVCEWFWHHHRLPSRPACSTLILTGPLLFQHCVGSQGSHVLEIIHPRAAADRGPRLWNCILRVCGLQNGSDERQCEYREKNKHQVLDTLCCGGATQIFVQVHKLAYVHPLSRYQTHIVQAVGPAGRECGEMSGWKMDGGWWIGWGESKKPCLMMAEPTSGSAQSWFERQPDRECWHRWTQSHSWLRVPPQVIKIQTEQKWGACIFSCGAGAHCVAASVFPEIICRPGRNTVCKYLCGFSYSARRPDGLDILHHLKMNLAQSCG